MKKYFFFIMLFVFVTTGCNTEEREGKICNIEQESELIAKLRNFNENLTMLPTTRKAPKDWVWWVTVGWEDVKGAYRGARSGSRIGSLFGPQGATIGAVAGALIVGGTCSYVVSLSVTPTEPSNPLINFAEIKIDEIYDNQISMLESAVSISNEKLETIKKEANVNVLFPTEYEYIEDVGALHNGVLEAVDYGKIKDEMNVEVFKDSAFEGVLANSLGDIDNLDKPFLIDSTALKILKSKEFKADYQAIIYDAINETGLTHELNLENEPQIDEDEDPIIKAVFALFKEVYTTYPEKMEDYDFLINRYIEIIETSDEVSKEDKEAIYSGFSVAAYTARYWDRKSNKTAINE